MGSETAPGNAPDRLPAAHAVSATRALPGMTFADFSELYGASTRTKHLLLLPSGAWGRVAFATRLLLGGVETTNKRLYSPPRQARVPREFIRLDPWEAEYLFHLAQLARRGIVEVGRFHGGSTFLLACANRQVPIWSIDLAPTDDDRLRRLLVQQGVGDNVELLVGDSQQGRFPEIGDFDLLFIDGDHSYQGCLRDLDNFYPRLAPGGHLALHDSYAESDVQQAVIDFIARTDVEVVRSPHIPSSHWHTSHGSIAHLTRPHDRSQPPTPRTAPANPVHRPAQLPSRRSGGARSSTPRPATSPRRGPGRTRIATILLSALILIILIFAAFPEALGDKPYNVV